MVPATPSNLRFTYTGVTGELMFRFEGDNNVNNFSVLHATSANGPWTDHDLSTSTRVKLVGLTAGTMYWGRARANGAKGSSDWSGPTCLMAI